MEINGDCLNIFIIVVIYKVGDYNILILTYESPKNK